LSKNGKKTEDFYFIMLGYLSVVKQRNTGIREL